MIILRESNPTRYELESVMSSLEGADDSIACSTGMAAIGIYAGFSEKAVIFYVQKICTAELCECLKALAKSED